MDHSELRKAAQALRDMATERSRILTLQCGGEGVGASDSFIDAIAAFAEAVEREVIALDRAARMASAGFPASL